jgi:aromatic amino acid aminotransferase I
MLTDSSSQPQNGLGQAFIAELLGGQGWGTGGFMKWMASLCREYERRRMDVFAREVAGSGLVSTIRPVCMDRNPSQSSSTADSMDALFRKLDCGLVMMPASTFAIVVRSGRVQSDNYIADVPLLLPSVTFGLTMNGSVSTTSAPHLSGQTKRSWTV